MRGFNRSGCNYLEMDADILLSCIIYIFWCLTQMLSVHSKNQGTGLSSSSSFGGDCSLQQETRHAVAFITGEVRGAGLAVDFLCASEQHIYSNIPVEYTVCLYAHCVKDK